jgi:hypothetical protein
MKSPSIRKDTPPTSKDKKIPPQIQTEEEKYNYNLISFDETTQMQRRIICFFVYCSFLLNLTGHLLSKVVIQTNKDPQRQHQLEESFAMLVAYAHDALNEDDEEPVVKLILRFELDFMVCHQIRCNIKPNQRFF